MHRFLRVPIRSRRRSARPRRRALHLVLVAALAAAGLLPAAVTPAAQAREARKAAQTPATAGAPVVAMAEDGTTMVFARTPADGLLRRERNHATAQWGAWIDTGGQTTGNAVVGHRLDGGLEVFATRASGHVWFQAQGASGWGAWSDMGTPTGTTAAGTPVVVADNNVAASTRASGQVQGNTDGRLELFVRGADDAIWHRAQKAPNDGGWSAWEKLGGGPWAGEPAAVVTGTGRIALAARTRDGHLNVTSQKRPSTQGTPLPTDNWAPWTDLGADFISNPQLVANAYRTNTGQTSTRGNGTLLQAFANRSDHHPWTVAQSQPGTEANPDGTWDTSHPYDLGLALTSPPVVAAASDGRLSLFGFNSDHTVVHRSQTHTLIPGTDATGIWDGGWPPHPGVSATALTVTRTAAGAFTVIVVDQASATMYAIDQLAAGTPDSPAGTWLDWSAPAPISTDHCAGAGAPDCLRIHLPDLNQDLDTIPGTTFEPVNRETPDPQSTSQKWALEPVPGATNGTFTILNHLTLGCIANDDSEVGVYPCGASAVTKWYLEPATTDSTGKPTGYRIHKAGAALCLTATLDSELSAPWVIQASPCGDGNPNHKQVWNLGGDGATAPGILNLALEHAAAACAGDKTSNCVFQDTSTPVPYNAPACVYGDVLYNNSPSSTATLGAEWKHLTGSDWSVGGEVSVGPFTSLGLGATFSTDHTWVDDDETSRTTDIEVPPGHFGWIEEAPLVMQTIGYWKFTIGGYTYTVPGHNLSNARDNTGGQNTLVITNTSPEPPTNAPCNQ